MYPQHVTIEAIKTLIDKFELSSDIHQDWEYVVADSSRLEEFLIGYKNSSNLNVDEKFALMIVIISSYDDALTEGISEVNIWKMIRNYLIQDIDIHLNTIIYWSLKDQEEDISEFDGGFAVSSRMIEIYDYCKINNLFNEC